MKIVVSYRGAPRIRGWETGACLARGFRKLGHEVFEYGNIYESKQRLENSPNINDKFDLWLYCEMNDGDSQYFESKNFKIRKFVCSLYDTSYYSDHLSGLQHHFNFDYQFIANPLDIKYFPNPYYLPYACDSELHSRLLSYPKTIDVALIGSIRDDRVGLKKELAKYGVQLELIGNVFRENYINALASVKIIINQNPRDGHGLLNMRYWETPAAGSLLFTEGVDMIVNDQTVRGSQWYDDIERLAASCRWFLKETEILQGTCKLAQEDVLSNHTYKNRCQEILKTVFPDEH